MSAAIGGKSYEGYETPDDRRFHELHSSVCDSLAGMLGLHHVNLENTLKRMERMIMTGFTEVEAEVAKVKGVVADLRTQIATLSSQGGATSAQLDQVITDLDGAIAQPAANPPETPPAADPGTGTTAAAV